MAEVATPISSRAYPMSYAELADASVEDYQHLTRIEFAGVTVAETKRGRMVLHPDYFAQIYIPETDVATELLIATTHCGPYTPDASYWTIETGAATASFAAWGYCPRVRPEISGHRSFMLHAVDAIHIDGARVRAHIRDHHTVFTVTPLGKHFRVEHFGRTIADSDRALVLTESGYHERYYVPAADVAMDLLVSSPRGSVCAYKGEATYHHIKVGERVAENLVWSYPDPWTDYCAAFARIKGHHAFFTSRCDSVLIGQTALDDDEGAVALDTRMLLEPNADAALKARMGQ